jgi:putative phosphoribosyl transferase
MPERLAPGLEGSPMATEQRDVAIVDGAARLPGMLSVPPGPLGLVIFAHGSGSSSRSPRNVAVAQRLNRDGLATLLFDLLTEEEAADRRNVFDIPLLGRRLKVATEQIAGEEEVRDAPVSYFGASTGAAAALTAAADLGHELIAAVVSRGGRPDLAGEKLAKVASPTLLIVGSRDPEVLRLNEEARRRLKGESELVVIPEATHLFEEPGALERVAELAAEWFGRHFTGRDRVAAGQ